MDLRGFKEFIKDFIKIAILVIVILAIYTWVISLQQVIGSRMSNTLNNGDMILQFRAK